MSRFHRKGIMISIDEMQDMLGRMMDELPDVFFRALNGGVNLLPDTRNMMCSSPSATYLSFS